MLASLKNLTEDNDDDGDDESEDDGGDAEGAGAGEEEEEEEEEGARPKDPQNRKRQPRKGEKGLAVRCLNDRPL